jgi:hypothetical protein
MGLLTGIVGVVVGGLIVAYAWGLDYVKGIEVVAILMAGLFVSVMVALFLPIGNMMVKAVAFCVIFALILLWGLSYIGVM